MKEEEPLFALAVLTFRQQAGVEHQVQDFTLAEMAAFDLYLQRLLCGDRSGPEPVGFLRGAEAE